MKEFTYSQVVRILQLSDNPHLEESDPLCYMIERARCVRKEKDLMDDIKLNKLIANHIEHHWARR